MNLGTCVYCDNIATTIDHIRPKSKGGYHTSINEVPCCGPCNSSKGGRLLTEWDSRKVLHATAMDVRIYDELIRIAKERQVSITVPPEMLARQHTLFKQIYVAAQILKIDNRMIFDLLELFTVDNQTLYTGGRSNQTLYTGGRPNQTLLLREIIDRGLIPMTYPALRKARQRDCTFPRGHTIKGRTYYQISDIQTWYASRPHNSSNTTIDRVKAKLA